MSRSRKKRVESSMKRVHTASSSPPDQSTPPPPSPPPPLPLIQTVSEEVEGGAFLRTSLSLFSENMHIVIREGLVHRISEDSGLLSFIHMVEETSAEEISWDDLETSLPPHMYKVSRMALALRDGLEFGLGTRSPREWMPNNENVRGDIVNKLSSGMTLLEISHLPLYPPYRVMCGWMKRDALFSEEVSQALSSLGQVMHDKALSEAKMASDQDPKATKALVDALKWSAMVANPERFNPAKKEEQQAPTTYNVVINTGIPMAAAPIAIDVTPVKAEERVNELEG